MAQSLQVLEGNFAQAADALYEKALDLNATQKETAEALSVVLNLRHKLLGMYGVKPDPQWKPGALVFHGAGGAAKGGAPPSFTWVGKLNEVMCKALKQPMTKGEVTYATVAADEAGRSFISTVSSAHFKGEYSGALPSSGKKQAEHEAAKAAMQAEYPEAYAQLATAGAVAVQPAAGQKRKSPAESTPPPAGKGLLSHYVQMLLQRSVTKQDIVYAVTKGGDGQFSATVTLSSYEGSPSYSGEGVNQKDAEMSAASIACTQLESIVTPLIAEHKANKAAKNAAKKAAK